MRDIPQIALGSVGFVILAYLIVSATSNAVNLTDGLDGLAAGAAAMVFGAYTLISFLQFRNPCGNHPIGRLLRRCAIPVDLALVAASAMSACFGFLWWNASPAQIFMGDTGSMALGGLMAGLAILSRTELLLIVLGGLFATVTISSGSSRPAGSSTPEYAPAPVDASSGWRRCTTTSSCRGWEEVTIIVRFWIIAGIAVAFGMGLFYAEFIGNG